MPLIDHDGYKLEEGYRLRKVVGLLSYPTNVEFSPTGEIFVSEAGFTYPFIYAQARILRLSGDTTEVMAEGFNGPLIGLQWHDGALLATHRGTLTRVAVDGRKTDLVTDLPSYGDHHTNHVVAKGDDIFFGQGSVTNSGIAGPDNLYAFGWLISHRTGHDTPPFDMVLSGANFRSRDPFNPLRHVETGPFLPVGERCTPGQVIKGELKANSVIYRCTPDGSDLEVFAWGLRNPYALTLDPAGRLLTIVQAEDNRGSRPFEEASDALYEVSQGAWYGWPDFCAGQPAEAFTTRVLPENPSGFVLQDHPSQSPQPLHIFPPHSAAVAITFSPGGKFGFDGEAFIAHYGSGAPITTGGKMISRGQRITRLDMVGMAEEDFYVNAGLTGGPRHPVQARFSPDGASLYVVDHGYMGTPKSGALYEITRE